MPQTESARNAEELPRHGKRFNASDHDRLRHKHARRVHFRGLREKGYTPVKAWSMITSYGLTEWKEWRYMLGYESHPVQASETSPEVIEAWARNCRCCTCCRQCPCPGVMAGGMCDDFPCVHDLMDDDAEED